MTHPFHPWNGREFVFLSVRQNWSQVRVFFLDEVGVQHSLPVGWTDAVGAARQYALRQRAIALGWPAEQVITIDCDQGQSGASATDREGFQRLVAEVGMGRAGIVLGLEVSRLARNNADWHRLLEIRAPSGTLICDEDGLYDPGEFNDRLLLGLKGTMSEAELHFIRARLRGGQLSKARRGELKMGLPVGLVYDPAERVVLDPDAGVRDALNHLFTVFARTGSARAVVQDFARDGLLFPVRIRKGAHKGELTWTSLSHWQVLRTLDNPRYAGAFVYGRRREARTPDGKKTFLTVPREQWTALFTDAHPGYLSWEQFEDIELRTEHAVEGIDTDAGRVSFAGGATLNYTVALAVPQAQPPAAVAESAVAGDGGWARPDRYSAATGFDRVYAVGDCTAVDTLPKAGVFAEAMGRVAARNIVAEITGERPSRYDGAGYCFLEFPDRRASALEGDFFTEPAEVTMAQPTTQGYSRKHSFERYHLRQWFGNTSANEVDS